MSLINLLRTAITTAGGTPTFFDNIMLLRQLVTAYGGSATQWTEAALLREAIVAVGGTPTQYSHVPLLRELIVAMGAEPTAYDERALLTQLSGLAPSDPSYTGIIATRGLMMDNQLGAGEPTSMSRTSHYATDDITSLQLVFPGWHADDAGEVVMNGTATWTASIEYPVGVFSQVKFGGGNNSGTCSPGALLLSDACNVTIPDGAEFWVRAFQSNPSGILFRLLDSTGGVNGKTNMEFGGVVTDKTMGGSVAGVIYFSAGPIAIIGQTTKATIAILGDSIAAAAVGLGAPFDDTTGEPGAIRPSLNNIGYVDFTRQSQTAAGHSAALTPLRRALAIYVSHVFNNLGVNDIGVIVGQGGTTNAALVSAQAAIQAAWGKPMICSTLTPATSGTFTTEAGQSINTQRQPIIAAYNDLLRAGGLPWCQGVVEVADVVENSRNGGKWKANYALDGIHPSPTGYNAMKASGVYTAAAFVLD